MKTREEMIAIIQVAIEHTHNEKDKKDLLEFTDEELKEIYDDYLESLK